MTEYDGHPGVGDRDALRELQNASPRTRPSPSAPLRAAREFLDEKHRAENGTLILRYWQGQWREWKTRHWAEVERVAVESTAYRFFDGAQYADAKNKLVPWNPNRHKVGDLLAAMQSVTHLPRDVKQPAWLNGYSHDGPIVSVANGLLHVSTGELHEHTPDYFNVVSVPFEYDPDAPEPTRWLDFLLSIWPDDHDEDQLRLLQEWFGYVVSGRTDAHKIFSLIGPTRSGKGVIARILGCLIGTENVAGPTLSSLGSDFGLAPLIGKPLAVIGDARLNGKGDQSGVVETLLSISGEDPRTVNIKYKEQWTGRLPTRFMILSNELPRLTDASGTIAHRFLPAMTTISHLGREDRTIEPHVVANEMPGVLNWALEGLGFLERRGKFTWPAAADVAVTRLQDLASPVHAFVRDRCEVLPGNRMTMDDMWAAWKTWADDNGHVSRTKQLLSAGLTAAYPQIQVRRNHEIGRFYDGVALASAPEGTPF